MKSKSTTYIIIGLIIVLPIIFFISSLFHKKQQASQVLQLQNATLLPSAQALPKFKLHDSDGKLFTSEQLHGHWSLIFFGFTRCPQICPTTLAELAQARQLMQQQNLKNIPQIIFISIDPDNDSNTKIAAYVNKFNAQMIGLTGSAIELNKLAKPVGIMFEKIPSNQANDYSMAHSNIILVVNPEGKWVALLMPPHQAQTIFNDFVGIQQHS
jgi:protein SCO1